MSKKLKVALMKSMIGRPEKHRRVLRSLGLKKPNMTVIVNDTATIKGMIQKVSHMLEVEEEVGETK